MYFVQFWATLRLAFKRNLAAYLLKELCELYINIFIHDRHISEATVVHSLSPSKAYQKLVFIYLTILQTRYYDWK